MQKDPVKNNNIEERLSEHIPAAPVRFFSHSTKVFRHHVSTEFILLGVIEFIVLLGSFYIGLEIRFSGEDWYATSGSQFSKALLFGVAMQSCMVAFGAYQRQSQQSINMLAVRLGGSLLIGMVLLGVVYYLVPAFFHGRGALALSVFVSFVAVMAVRLVLRRISEVHDMRLRVMVLGAGDAANLVRNADAKGELDDVNIVGYISMPGDNNSSKMLDLISNSGRLLHFVDQENIDVIVLAMDERRKGLPVHDLLDCKMGGVDVLDLLTFFERYTNKIRLDIMQPSWLFLSDGFRVSHFRRIWKRVFDILVVLLLVPVIMPVILLAVAAILAESRGRGSVLYTQTRVGENSRLFQIYKFRSMVVDAEHDGVARWAEKNDSRITRVGAFLRKFRLDEIPQLYNILKGDMSFVGPRPERPEFVARLSEKIPYYNERHRVRPGLSGWAQIRYSYGASEEDGLEKLQYDLYYVKNYSILLDALVLLQTAEVVLLGRGAQ